MSQNGERSTDCHHAFVMANCTQAKAANCRLTKAYILLSQLHTGKGCQLSTDNGLYTQAANCLLTKTALHTVCPVRRTCTGNTPGTCTVHIGVYVSRQPPRPSACDLLLSHHFVLFYPTNHLRFTNPTPPTRDVLSYVVLHHSCVYFDTDPVIYDITSSNTTQATYT